MLNNFNGDYAAAAAAYCGLEAKFTTPDGRTATLYIADGFADPWVLTPTSIDIIINSVSFSFLVQMRIYIYFLRKSISNFISFFFQSNSSLNYMDHILQTRSMLFKTYNGNSLETEIHSSLTFLLHLSHSSFPTNTFYFSLLSFFRYAWGGPGN